MFLENHESDMTTKCYYNPTTYTDSRTVTEICAIHPFVDQRDIDSKRLKPIIAKLESDLEKHTQLYLDTPIILLECCDYGSFLLDRNQQRVPMVIVDGQHRVAALSTLLSRQPKNWPLDYSCLCAHC